MIAQVRGIVAEKSPTRVVLDVSGVGYEINIPVSTYEKLPNVGGEIRLLTHLHVREDAMQLFGFSNDQEVDGGMKRLADTCRSMLCSDTDGKVIVDFLGQTRRRIVASGGREEPYVQAVKKGYRFVCSELQRFTATGDIIHAPRYQRLKDYMDPRLSNWGNRGVIGGHR